MPQDQNKPKLLELKLQSDLQVDPKMTEIPVHLLADRLIIEYIEPSKEIEIAPGKIIFKPVGIGEGMATGKIVAIGDSCDTSKPIPEVLRKLGLIVRYGKGFAEEIEYEKRVLHMVRWTEVAYIV